MFRWYRNSAKCYVYLTDVSTCQQEADGTPSWELAFRKSRWFTRGWTLQELIAPTVLEFFSEDRKRLGDKTSLTQHIRNVTGIPLEALQANALSNFSFEVRMSWIEKRSTTREEDKAYCLLDIHVLGLAYCAFFAFHFIFYTWRFHLVSSSPASRG